jgi:hypothetical protein
MAENHVHYAPEGWEETDRAICHCGALIRWNPKVEKWRPSRRLRVLVLTREEARDVLFVLVQANGEVRQHGDPTPPTIAEIDLQLRLQEPA